MTDRRPAMRPQSRPSDLARLADVHFVAHRQHAQMMGFSDGLGEVGPGGDRFRPQANQFLPRTMEWPQGWRGGAGWRVVARKAPDACRSSFILVMVRTGGCLPCCREMILNQKPIRDSCRNYSSPQRLSPSFQMVGSDVLPGVKARGGAGWQGVA